MKIALLTDNEHIDLIPDEKNLIQHFNNNDIAVDVCIWSKETNWSLYDFVIIRSTWDYSFHYEEFKIVLQKIALTSNLLNSYETVLWNSNKDYLNLMSEDDLKRVPTQRYTDFKESDVEDYFKTNSFSSVVLKPTVGLGGIDTFKISEDMIPDLSHLEGRDMLIQPFLESIVSKGEYSFICFNGRYSHAVVKHAMKGEFRVQDDHGGTVQKYVPTGEQIGKVENFLKSLDDIPLYARVDIVDEAGTLYLMELELIEPELFFRFSKDGEQKFIEALLERK